MLSRVVLVLHVNLALMAFVAGPAVRVADIGGGGGRGEEGGEGGKRLTKTVR